MFKLNSLFAINTIVLFFLLIEIIKKTDSGSKYVTQYQS